VGHIGDRVAGSEEAERLEQAELATPPCDGHSSVGKEQPFESAAARTDGCGELGDAGCRGLGKPAGESSGSGIPRLRELEWRLANLVELVEDAVDKVAVAGVASIERAAMDSFDDELAQQWRDVYHLQLGGHGVQLGLEVEGSVATRPCIWIRMLWPSGTQSARFGGTTQIPIWVSTLITPEMACISWSQ
jgi:hypothetical protein